MHDVSFLKLNASRHLSWKFHVSPSFVPRERQKRTIIRQRWMSGKSLDTNEQTVNEQTGDRNCPHDDQGGGIGRENWWNIGQGARSSSSAQVLAPRDGHWCKSLARCQCPAFLNADSNGNRDLNAPSRKREILPRCAARPLKMVRAVNPVMPLAVAVQSLRSGAFLTEFDCLSAHRLQVSFR